MFKVIDAGISGQNHNVTLYVVDNWTVSTTKKDVALSFTAHSDKTPTAASVLNIPVIVYKGNNIFEVFCTVSIGRHNIYSAEEGHEDEVVDTVVGANVQKAIIDVSDVDDIAVTYEDLGIIPHVITGYGTNVSQYMSGQYIDGKYYLPIGGLVNSMTETIESTQSASYQEGVCFSNDGLTAVEKKFIYRPDTNRLAFWVMCDNDDKILQLMPNVTNELLFFKATDVVSGTNLQTPIVKTNSDILRVTYKYSMVDEVTT
jgi:hypothetical protein